MPGSGDPYCSLVNVATAADGAPLLLISRLAVHTKNILVDPRVSLMLDERKEGDPLQGGRIMMVGTAAVTGDPNARLIGGVGQSNWCGTTVIAALKFDLTYLANVKK